MYARFGYIVTVYSSRGKSKNDIDVQVKLVGDNEPVVARLINNNNSIDVPEEGTPCIVECVNDENNLWARTINKDDVMRILQGEKVIFDSAQNKVYLRKDNGILIETVKGNINITSNGDINITSNGDINITGKVNITGNVDVTGNLQVSGTTDLTGITTIETKPFIAHTHSGVTTGLNNTGIVT
tara:strand:- start:27788 stop:28339 length:552 start_codon:yes stop_codon:yes gene_type:complete